MAPIIICLEAFEWSFTTFFQALSLAETYHLTTTASEEEQRALLMCILAYTLLMCLQCLCNVYIIAPLLRQYVKIGINRINKIYLNASSHIPVFFANWITSYKHYCICIIHLTIASSISKHLYLFSIACVLFRSCVATDSNSLSTRKTRVYFQILFFSNQKV